MIGQVIGTPTTPRANIGQTGAFDNGNLWSGTYANGTWSSYTYTDANGDETWSTISYLNYDAAEGLWE